MILFQSLRRFLALYVTIPCRPSVGRICQSHMLTASHGPILIDPAAAVRQERAGLPMEVSLGRWLAQSLVLRALLNELGFDWVEVHCVVAARCTTLLACDIRRDRRRDDRHLLVKGPKLPNCTPSHSSDGAGCLIFPVLNVLRHACNEPIEIGLRILLGDLRIALRILDWLFQSWPHLKDLPRSPSISRLRYGGGCPKRYA